LAVIPAYNEGRNIGKLLVQLQEAVPFCDILVVDDCSSDDTAEVVTDLGINLITLPCNLGYALALQTGLHYAIGHGYNVVILMDGDGQHDPLDIPRLLTPIKCGDADLVIGSRFTDSGNYKLSFGRAIGIKIFSSVVRLLAGQKIRDTSSGFKAMRISVARALLEAHFVDFHTEVIVYLRWLGYRIVECPVRFIERIHGTSMYSFTSYIAYPTKTLLLTVAALWEAKRQRTLRKQL